METSFPTRSDCDAASGSAVNHAEKRIGFNVVCIVLGVLLLTGAGLKFTDDGFGFEDGLGPFTSPLGRLAVIEAEAILGMGLLLGLAPRFLWLVALLFFSALAGVRLHLGIEGQPSCGWFGMRLPVKPWYSFALDLAAVAALMWWRPPRGHRLDVPYTAMLRKVFAVAACSVVILAVVSGGLTFIYSTPYEAILHFRGELLTPV